MSAAYQVNINIHAGSNFNQEFFIVNPDSTPRDLTGCVLSANLSKHAVSVDAVRSTSSRPVYKIVPFTTRVVDGQKGIVSISMNPQVSVKLKEGKYVYDVVLKEPSGGFDSVVRGLAFVSKSFGHLPIEMIYDGGGSTIDNPSGIILDGGGALL